MDNKKDELIRTAIEKAFKCAAEENQLSTDKVFKIFNSFFTNIAPQILENDLIVGFGDLGICICKSPQAMIKSKDDEAVNPNNEEKQGNIIQQAITEAIKDIEISYEDTATAVHFFLLNLSLLLHQKERAAVIFNELDIVIATRNLIADMEPREEEEDIFFHD